MLYNITNPSVVVVNPAVNASVDTNNVLAKNTRVAVIVLALLSVLATLVGVV